MDWIKIPTDSILYSEFKDSELIALIKYQALYCQLETEPTLAQLKRVLNQKQLKFVQSYSQVVQELCKSQTEKIKHKRNKEKENYKQKQLVAKNSVNGKLSERKRTIEADKIRIDKRREDILFLSDKSSKNNIDSSDEPNKYVFEGEIIKLKQKDFDRWKKAYPNLNLWGELMLRDDWLKAQPPDVQKKWFVSTSQFFIKQNEKRKKQNQDLPANDSLDWLDEKKEFNLDWI